MFLKVLVFVLVVCLFTEFYAEIRFKRTPMFGVTRFQYPWEKNQAWFIGMTITPWLAIKLLFTANKKRLLIKQLIVLLNRLSNDRVYKAKTHDVILKQIFRLEREGKLRVIEKKSLRKRGLFIEKIVIGNFNNLFQKVPMYEIVFKIT
ncbi:MAG: hypothetical protein LLG02_14110 [Pelosinus sp.]|nr:hypothetical protein [Pelosinus sp.]